MKLTVLLFLLTVQLGMSALTALQYMLSSHLVGGSVQSMEVVSASGIAFPLFSISLFGLLSYWCYKKFNAAKLFLLAIVFSCWLLSGRIVSILVWPEVIVNTGWFIMQDEKINLCENQPDCETAVIKGTSVTTLNFWRIRIKNNKLNKVVFVGPFIWNKTLDNFSKEIHVKVERE
jgi:hypothetical protein